MASPGRNSELIAARTRSRASLRRAKNARAKWESHREGQRSTESYAQIDDEAVHGGDTTVAESGIEEESVQGKQTASPANNLKPPPVTAFSGESTHGGHGDIDGDESFRAKADRVKTKVEVDSDSSDDESDAHCAQRWAGVRVDGVESEHTTGDDSESCSDWESFSSHKRDLVMKKAIFDADSNEVLFDAMESDSDDDKENKNDAFGGQTEEEGLHSFILNNFWCLPEGSSAKKACEECCKSFEATFVQVYHDDPERVFELWEIDESMLQAMIPDSSEKNSTPLPVDDQWFMNDHYFFRMVLHRTLCVQFTNYFTENEFDHFFDAAGRCFKGGLYPSPCYTGRNAERPQNFDLIGMVDMFGGTVVWYSRQLGFKVILKDFAKCIGKRLSSLQFQRNGLSTFLSELGKQTPHVFGMVRGDMILVTPRPQAMAKDDLPLKSMDNKMKFKSQSLGHNKIGRSQRKKKKAPKPTPSYAAAEEETRKKDIHKWMRSISDVHAEGDALFKTIRQKLNQENLQRTLPKQRKVVKSGSASRKVDNPSSVGLSSKPGKKQLVVRVGDAENLYKTTKHSMKTTPLNVSAVLDLHGFTREEALYKLNASLPDWVDDAMKGEYPWVVLVNIVCGGGSQILSEAVEKWIKQTGNVSNAPKSDYL